MHLFHLSQLPTPAAGDLEKWLISAAAAASLVVLARKLLPPRVRPEADFVTKTEFLVETNALRDRIDARFLNLGQKIDELRADLLAADERRANLLHSRLNDLVAGLARVDERTKH